MLKKDIRKIVDSFVNESEVCDGINIDELADRDALVLEICEYIENTYGKKETN